MNTILSQKESALLARHFEQAQEAERLLRLAQETDLMAGRTRAKLEASLSALADGAHIVTDANGHQHRIIKVGGQIEDIELVQPVPCANHAERNTPNRCRRLCQTCKEAAIGVALLLFTCLSANAQTPADAPPAGEAPAASVWVHSAQQLEDVPGAQTWHDILPHNPNIMSTEHYELTLPSRIRARAIRERHPHK